MRKIALLVGLLLVLAGCASLAKLDALGKELDAAGYDVVGLNHNSSPSGAVLSVSVAQPGELATEEAAEDVAAIVWTKFEGDFDQLQVAINAQQMLTASTADLTERFGDRPAGLTDGGTEREGMNVTALLVILSIAAAFAALLFVVWRRGRRSTPPVVPPGHVHPGGPNYAANPYAGPPPPPQQP